MKKTILTSIASICLFCLAFTSSAVARPITPPISDDSVKAQLIRDWERAKVYTKAYLDVMPEDGFAFKPTPDIRSFAEQMLHLSQANINFISAGTGKAKIYDGKTLEKMDELKNKAAVTKVVMESYDYAIDALKGFDASKFSEPAKFASFTLPRIVILNKGFEHQSHHRGQCTIYIRLKGVKPPNEMLF